MVVVVVVVGVGSAVNKTWSLMSTRQAYSPCTWGSTYEVRPHMRSCFRNYKSYNMAIEIRHLVFCPAMLGFHLKEVHYGTELKNVLVFSLFEAGPHCITDWPETAAPGLASDSLHS